MSDTPSGQGNKTSHSQFNIAVMYESYRYLPSQRLLLFDPSIVISVEFSNFYFTVVMAFVTYFFFFQKFFLSFCLSFFIFFLSLFLFFLKIEGFFFHPLRFQNSFQRKEHVLKFQVNSHSPFSRHLPSASASFSARLFFFLFFGNCDWFVCLSANIFATLEESGNPLK